MLECGADPATCRAREESYAALSQGWWYSVPDLTCQPIAVSGAVQLHNTPQNEVKSANSGDGIRTTGAMASLSIARWG